MLTFEGKYTTAEVMIDDIEKSAISQIYDFINCSCFPNPVRIMPDVHYGAGAVIGFSMELADNIIPNVVGVDQSCGVFVIKLIGVEFDKIDRENFDKQVRQAVPMSNKVRRKPAINMEREFDWAPVQKDAVEFTAKFNSRYDTEHRCPKIDNNWFKILCKRVGIDYMYACNSIGTMGGGNHYIEIGKDEQGDPWLSVHSGSRNLGKRTADFWQDVAIRTCESRAKAEYDELVNHIKETMPKERWQGAISALKDRPKVPRDLSYLVEENMYLYLIDAIFLHHYAALNREVIARAVIKQMPLEAYYEGFHTVHNYVDYNDFIIRKGAIASYEDQVMAIPFNQEDGTLICEGKSNPDWNYTAPHGAGRISSRADAKKVANVEAARASLEDKGIYSSTLPLDELKQAYKPAEVIERAIEPTARIIHRVRPVINFKAKK